MAEEHDHTVEGAPNAKKVAISSCGHGLVHMDLLDKDGKVFARASWDVWAVADLVEMFMNAVDHVTGVSTAEAPEVKH